MHGARDGSVPCDDQAVITPKDIHDVAFGTPPTGKRGYDETEVDELLARLTGRP